MNLQEQYFKTVHEDFAARISVLSKLIQSHPGEQGRHVENVVRDLLQEFLPDRYSFGSGFVIDSQGQQSRQCDIVIYDTMLCAGLLRRTGPLLFPIEAVYGVIEIKSTLNKQEVSDAYGHIASVKRLVNRAESTFEAAITEDGQSATREIKPSPPIGVVVGYKSNTRTLATINSWFSDAMSEIPDVLDHPDLCVSIEEAAIIQYMSRSHRSDRLQRKFFPLPVRDANGGFQRSPEGAQILLRPSPEVAQADYEYVGEVDGYNYNCTCKVCQDPRGGYILSDAPRALLQTLDGIAILLSFKKLSAKSVLKHYLPTHYGEAFTLEPEI